MENKIIIIALFGGSGSGKDSLKNMVYATVDNVYKIIRCTTRTKRDNETEGEDYNFLTPEEFAEKVGNGDMLEAVSFNNWFYGTDIHNLKTNGINIGAFDPFSIECLLKDSRLKVYPFKVEASDKERLIRALNREDNPNCQEICRRYLEDNKDLCDIPFEYKTLKNETIFDLHENKEFFNHFCKTILTE